MYIVEEGEVALVDPRNEMKPAEKLLDGDAIGELACIIGARHAVSAVATMDTRVWALHKRDFDKLLHESPCWGRRFTSLSMPKTWPGI